MSCSGKSLGKILRLLLPALLLALSAAGTAHALPATSFTAIYASLPVYDESSEPAPCGSLVDLSDKASEGEGGGDFPAGDAPYALMTGNSSAFGQSAPPPREKYKNNRTLSKCNIFSCCPTDSEASAVAWAEGLADPFVDGLGPSDRAKTGYKRE